MNRILAAGLVLTVGGVIGYGIGVAGDVGVVDPYPGRAFTVTGVMIGITLMAVGLGERGEAG